MEELKQRIVKDGRLKEGNILKVDSFLNHQMDIDLFNKMGQEFYRLFEKDHVNKILTIEASGIGIACVAAQYFHVPVVFAKKSQSANIDGDVYTTKVESFTHKRVYDIIVSKKFLNENDRVLIIDDFLAKGQRAQRPVPFDPFLRGDAGGGRHCHRKGVSRGRPPDPFAGRAGGIAGYH